MLSALMKLYPMKLRIATLNKSYRMKSKRAIGREEKGLEGEMCSYIKDARKATAGREIVKGPSGPPEIKSMKRPALKAQARAAFPPLAKPQESIRMKIKSTLAGPNLSLDRAPSWIRTEAKRRARSE
jgi:hypothetical protein